MSKKITRRVVLTSAPALAASVAIAAPANAANLTSIMALFERWNEVRNQVNSGTFSDAEEDGLFVKMAEIEVQIAALPCFTAADLAAKFNVHTDCGGFDPDQTFGIECEALLANSAAFQQRNAHREARR